MPKHLEETVVDIESVFAVINEQFDNLWPFVGVSCLLAQSFLFSYIKFRTGVSSQIQFHNTECAHDIL